MLKSVITRGLEYFQSGLKKNSPAGFVNHNEKKFRKVALIYPAKRNMGCWPALGLAYIAAMLEKVGHTVSIIDRNPVLSQGGDVEAFTRKALADFKPDFVGITATTPLMEDVVSILHLLQETIPGIPLILGGPHVTALPEATLKQFPEVDIVVRGEGELTMPEIVAGCPLTEVLGITWRKDGEVISNPARPLITDLDALPFPSRNLFDMEFYLQPDNIVIRGLRGIRATHIYNARGCYYNCKFCAGAAVFGREVRSNSAHTIVEEINHLINEYNVEALYFDEDVFFSSRLRAETICKALIEAEIPKKIKWAGLMRANAAPFDVLKMMKDSGCVQVEFGFETGSARMLKVVRKGVILEQNYAAARNSHKAGLRLLASMIVGCPSETSAEYNETIEFLRDIEPHYIGFNKFIPLPGSQFFNELSAAGKLGNEDWGVYHVGGSFPEQKMISYSEIEGPEFFRKFCEDEQKFIRDSNLAGTIISLLNILEEKQNGFSFSILKPDLFTIAIPEKRRAETDFCWEKALEIIEGNELCEIDDFKCDDKLSTDVRGAWLNNLGVHLIEDFRLRLAGLCLRSAQPEQESPLVLANLGVLAFRRKEYEKADSYFTSALLNPGSYKKQISWNWANTCLLSGRLEQAREMYEKFDNDFAVFNGQIGLAATYVLFGDFKQARNCWEKAIGDDEGLPEAIQNIKASQNLSANGGHIIGHKSITDLYY